MYDDTVAIIVIIVLVIAVAALVWAIFKQGGSNDYTSRVVGTLVSPQAGNVADYGGVSGFVNHYRYTAKLRVEAYVDAAKTVARDTNNQQLLVIKANLYDQQRQLVKTAVIKGTKCRLLLHLTKLQYQQLVDEQMFVEVVAVDAHQPDKLVLSGLLHVYQ